MENKIHSYLLQSLCKTHLKKKNGGSEVFPVTSILEQEKNNNSVLKGSLV